MPIFLFRSRKGKISKTENGPFHRFVNDIRYFATGSREGEAATFAYIKKNISQNELRKKVPATID